MTTISVTEASRQLSQLVTRTTDEHEIVVLTSQGQAKAVLISTETYAHLIGMREHLWRETPPADNFQREFQTALVEAGFDSREKIIELVRDVKRELADERVQQRTMRPKANGQ